MTRSKQSITIEGVAVPVSSAKTVRVALIYLMAEERGLFYRYLAEMHYPKSGYITSREKQLLSTLGLLDESGEFSKNIRLVVAGCMDNWENGPGWPVAGQDPVCEHDGVWKDSGRWDGYDPETKLPTFGILAMCLQCGEMKGLSVAEVEPLFPERWSGPHDWRSLTLPS